jgi:signal transduction histidine kinase
MKPRAYAEWLHLSMAPPEVSTDDDLRRARLAGFIGPMTLIALAFLGFYVSSAIALQSLAFAGASCAVAVYVMALLMAKSAAARGDVERAARICGVAVLLLMVMATPFLQFAAPALVVIPLAGVAIMLPFLSGRALVRYMIAALVVDVYVILVCAWLPPLVPPPAEVLHAPITVAGTVAAVGLTVRMMWMDSKRLHRSLDEARRAVALRDEFMSIAGHELRTPLAALRLQVDRMVRTAPDDAKAQRIQRQTERLAGLVDVLLDVTRMESTRDAVMRLDRAPHVSLAHCARTVIADLHETLARAGCEVHTTLDDEARGTWDAARVEQAITNVVANAAKYGAGKPVDVHVRVEDGSWAALDVIDRGMGIAPEDLERVFEKFERAVSTSHYGGLGLGLWIVRRIAEAHGGTATARSTQGEGTTLTLRLPMEHT